MKKAYVFCLVTVVLVGVDIAFFHSQAVSAPAVLAPRTATQVNGGVSRGQIATAGPQQTSPRAGQRAVRLTPIQPATSAQISGTIVGFSCVPGDGGTICYIATAD